jgi:DNA-binding response OmpR family regulator
MFEAMSTGDVDLCFRTMDHHVLVVEDDEDIATLLVRTLEREGYAVTWASRGGEALGLIASEAPHVVILDVGLPDIDGFQVCKQAREAGYDGGIIIVTARAGELDRVVGLDYGADDYLPKPFALAELHARVRALLRRSAPRPAAEPVPTPSTPGSGLRVDLAARRAFAADTELQLTAKEFDVLAILVDERGAVVSRERLMSDVWDENWFGSTKTLDVTIGRLRTKLVDSGATERVAAVRGVGFRLESSEQDA